MLVALQSLLKLALNIGTVLGIVFVILCTIFVIICIIHGDIKVGKVKSDSENNETGM